MRDRDLPSPEYLRQRLRYEPETGKLFWRHWEPRGAGWNTKYAGREAFAVPHKEGYLKGSIDDIRIFAHHVVWAVHYGVWPSDQLDHRDKKRTNNRIKNLRPSNWGHNARNKLMMRNNTSGVTGVDWFKPAGLWRARINDSNKRNITLGYSHSFDEAVAMRKAAEIEHGYDPNHGAPRP